LQRLDSYFASDTDAVMPIAKRERLAEIHRLIDYRAARKATSVDVGYGCFLPSFASAPNFLAGQA
jgi:hypothetical protein